VKALSLRRLGKIFHLSRSGNLILKLEDPRIPSTRDVLDSKLRVVGRLVEVFGPVKSPYALVKPVASEPEGVVGKVVYCADGDKT